MGKRKLNERTIDGDKYIYIRGHKKKSDAKKLAAIIRRNDKRKVRVVKNLRKGWTWPYGVYSGPKKKKR